MKKNCPKTNIFALLFLITIALLLTHSSTPASAQSSDISYSYSIPIEGDQSIQNGNIISIKNGQYILSNEEYDIDTIGIVNQNSAIQFEISSQRPTYPLIAKGHSIVKINPINGNIQVGDFITSSTMPGIGMKAAKNGQVIGQALENYTFTSPNEIGQILVSINIHTTGSSDPSTYPQTSLTNIFYKGLSDIFHLPSPSTLQPTPPFFRYTLAGIITLSSIAFSYLTFFKVTRLGVEAIGRNPLAKKSIMTGVIFNASIGSFIIFAGIIVTYYIVRI